MFYYQERATGKISPFFLSISLNRMPAFLVLGLILSSDVYGCLLVITILCDLYPGPSLKDPDKGSILPKLDQSEALSHA